MYVMRWPRLSGSAPATVAQLLARLAADAESDRAPPLLSNAIIGMRSHTRPRRKLYSLASDTPHGAAGPQRNG